jgi:5,10-methylenetetrahydromethanopterin reductase
VRFGLSFGALYRPVAELARAATEAEVAGFLDLWVPDSPMLYRDPYATLALLAGATRHARLGTLATNPVIRHPAATASAILTVQELASGRACLGLATGDSAVRRLGREPARLDELETAIREIRALTAGRPASGASGEFTVRFAAGPPVPIFVVATGDRTLELGGRVADGVVLNVGVHPAVLAAARAKIAQGARAAGRDPAEVAIVVFAFCLIADDRETARARVAPSVTWLCQRFPELCALAGHPVDPATRKALARFGQDYARYDLVHAAGWAEAVRDAAFLPPQYVDAFALAGTGAEVRAQVDALAGLGVPSLTIRPPSSEDWHRTVRAFAGEVIPAFRSPA